MESTSKPRKKRKGERGLPCLDTYYGNRLKEKTKKKKNEGSLYLVESFNHIRLDGHQYCSNFKSYICNTPTPNNMILFLWAKFTQFYYWVYST